MNKKLKILILSIIFFTLSLNSAFAIPPPDFVMQIVSQAGVYFSLAVAFFATSFGVVYRYFSAFYSKYRVYIIIFLVLLLSGSYITYDYFKSKAETEILLNNGGNNLNNWLNNTGNRSKLDSSRKRNILVEVKRLTYEEEVEILLNKEEEELIKYLNPPSLPGRGLEGGKEFITNSDFKKIIDDSDNNYFILDAREDLENEIGSVPGSIHIRPADLKYENRLKDLPKDKIIVVLCWSGIRGKVVSDYLKNSGLKSVFLENGLKSWVDSGGVFDGEIEFSEVYKEFRYRRVFSKAQFLDYLEDGVKIIDAREPYKINSTNRLDYATELSIMYTKTSETEKKLLQFKSGDKVIVVCDDYVNCFDAKLVGVELERRGVKFLGRFAKPWDL